MSGLMPSINILLANDQCQIVCIGAKFKVKFKGAYGGPKLQKMVNSLK